MEESHPKPPKGMVTFLAMLFGTLMFLLACNVYLFLRSERIKGDFAYSRSTMLRELSSLREAASRGDATGQERQARLDFLQREIKTKQQELETKQRQLEAASSRAARAAIEAKVEAERNLVRLAKVAAEREQQERHLAREIRQMKEADSVAGSKLDEVSSEVEATRSELHTTLSDLRRVASDVEALSGLVATNGIQLNALKELGVRNYFEFNLTKSNYPYKVGDIKLVLKKANPKRKRYTVEILADDKRIEKKDRTTNEPVQFYLASSRYPYELVVNEVRKDQLVGYLATPKTQMARN